MRANPGSRGPFTLVRQSRTITKTRITIAGRVQGHAAPRQTVPIDEIVVDQRQVFLPGDPGNVGEQYRRGMEKPLLATTTH